MFLNDDIELTIECDDVNSMTVEPYSFYFFFFFSQINFTGIEGPNDEMQSFTAKDSNDYYYVSLVSIFISSCCYSKI